MSVTRYRSIEEMPRPWRDPDDPGNLRVVAQMLTFHKSLVRTVPQRTGVQRFRNLHEANESGNNPDRH